MKWLNVGFWNHFKADFLTFLKNIVKTQSDKEVNEMYR